MDLFELKLHTLHYIKDDEVLSNKEKIKFMEFVRKSSEKDMMFLLTTGQIPGDKVSMIEQADGVAFRINEYGDSAVTTAIDAGLASSPIGTLGARALYHTGKIVYQAARTVGTMKGDLSSKFAKFNKYDGMATSTVSSVAASLALKVRKGQIEKMNRVCDKETGMAKKVCYNKVRRDAMRREITSLSVSKNRCEYTNNPDKCIKKIDDRIKEIQTKMDSIKVF